MKAPTEAEIREEVYRGTMQETGREVEQFINGALWVAEKWRKAIEEEQKPVKEYIYERDEDKIYRRESGLDVKEPLD